MLQKERTTATTANLCSVMESGNHSKNGASLKSLMSKGNWWITACLFLFLALAGACKDEKDNELPAPTDLTATQVEDGINVSWHYVKGADCYMLQIADEAGNSQQVDVYDCDYVFKPEKDGTYSFVVSARNSKDLGKLSNTVYCAYTAPKKEVTEGSILGSWFCEEEGITIILNADGTYTYKERGYEENGTYVFEDSKLTLRDEDGELSEQYVVKSVTDTTLEMTDLYENDWTFTKGSGEGDDNEGDDEDDEKNSNEDLIGLWGYQDWSVYKTFVFNNDSTYVYKETTNKEVTKMKEGTFRFEDLKLTLMNEYGLVSESYTVESVTDSTLKIKNTNSYYDTYMTFEKLEEFELTVPTGLKAVQVAGQKIQVSWDPVEDADRYSLEYTYKYLTTNYYGQSEKEYNKVVEVQSNEYLYSPEYLTGVKSFSFSVRAIHDIPYEETAWSDTVSCDYMTPGGGTKSGLYMGIIGFNNTLNTKSISLLTDYENINNSYDFSSFIDRMNTTLATTLYYAVDNAVKHLKIATLPEDLENVAIVTFTDGLDNSSTTINPIYDSPNDYRDAVKESIRNTKIKNQDINAYSIGVGNKSNTEFQAALDAMASVDSNSYNVDDMKQVNETFDRIANELFNKSKKTTLQLSITTGLAPGTRIRFALDRDTLATSEEVATSEVYIEGEFRRNGKIEMLEHLVFHGVKSSSDTIKITGIPNEETLLTTFYFEDFAIESEASIDLQKMTEWYYIPEGDKWSLEDEFGKQDDIKSVVQRKSAVILLVLDCTTSLGDGGFRDMKNAATNFINTVTKKE